MGRTWTKNYDEEGDKNMKDKMSDAMQDAKDAFNDAKDTVKEKMAGDREAQKDEAKAEDDALASGDKAAMTDRDEQRKVEMNLLPGEYPSNTGATMLPPPDDKSK